MAEIVTLTTPITRTSVNSFRLERLVIDVEHKSITVQWLGDNDLAGSASYPTPAPAGSSQPSGATLLTTLNKLNSSGANPSLVNRILARLQSDGYIGAGSISGTPD
jgi:hypothetical protein